MNKYIKDKISRKLVSNFKVAIKVMKMNVNFSNVSLKRVLNQT